MITIDNFGKKLGSGAGSDVFEYGNNKVCKLSNPQNANDLQYEYNLMLEINKNGIPAPKVYNMVEYDGRVGFIMDRVYGTSLLEIMFTNIVDYHNKRFSNKDIFYSDVMMDTIKCTVTALFDIHQKKCELKETAKSYLLKRCQYNPFITFEEKDKIEYIIKNLSESDTVCHGDTNPGNFIKLDEKITIIDWSNCVRGSYYLDIAEYILTMRNIDILVANIFVDAPNCILNFLREYKEEFINVFCSQYNKLSEINFIELNKWFIPVLAAKMGCNQAEEITTSYLGDLRKRLSIEKL